MNHFRLFAAVGWPTVAVWSSLVISLVQISALREDMRAQNSALRAEMGDLRADMREIGSDIKLLTGKVYEMMGQK